MDDESTSELIESMSTRNRTPVSGDGSAGSNGPNTIMEGRAVNSDRNAQDVDRSRLCDQATNVVEIVGTVMPQRRTDRGSVARTLISPTRAITAQIALQVHEEDGEAYGLQLVLSPRVGIKPGVLETLAEDDRVQVRGRLSWRDTHDLRFASAEHPLGRTARELVVTVLHLERADPAAVDGSWVRVQGTVLVPPQLRPHETIPGLRVARTSLQVTVRIPSSRPGSRAEFVETANIPIDVPIDLPGVGAAFRAGNRAILEGRLERYRQRIQPERSAPVSLVLEAMRARQESELAHGMAQSQEAERRHGARELRSLLYEDRLRLRVGYVELLSGTMLNDLDEVARNRQVWTSAAQARRARHPQGQDRSETQVEPKDGIGKAS